MYPEDRVLVGVVNRQQDLRILLEQGWYRIPYVRMMDGVLTEYVAFFCQPKGANARGIYYYARLKGVELVRRVDLLPDEAHHSRAEAIYYKCQFSQIYPRTPAILNTQRRAFAFIYTTWDRFEEASVIGDLYTKNQYYVSRVYYALPHPLNQSTAFRPYRLR